MASTQKRWLTNPTSKLSKAELTTMLRSEDAWQLLPEDTRQRLYALLPAPTGDEQAHDINVHPLQTRYKPYIDEELRCWQQDLRDGKESKKWREDAMRAGSERTQGKWDEWKAKDRESTWGKQRANAAKPETQAATEDAVVDGGESDEDVIRVGRTAQM